MPRYPVDCEPPSVLLDKHSFTADRVGAAFGFSGDICAIMSFKQATGVLRMAMSFDGKHLLSALTDNSAQVRVHVHKVSRSIEPINVKIQIVRIPVSKGEEGRAFLGHQAPVSNLVFLMIVPRLFGSNLSAIGVHLHL
jgi:hypothetical protein